ncbi:MAG: DUF2752 domain-containing protein [Bacteroidia bacterium]
MIKWLNEHLFSCFFLKHFHLPCPGCGMQRSFLALIQGQITESIILYPALIPTIIMLLLLITHILRPFPGSLKYLVASFLISTTILMAGYILKIIQLINL